MRRISILAILAGIGMSGCMQQPVDPARASYDPRTRDVLTQAAREVQKDVRQLYGLKTASSGKGMGAVSDLKFVGTLETLVQEVAQKTGYTSRFIGRKNNQAIVVKITNFEPMSWFEVLQSAGIQAGERAMVHIDEPLKEIVVTYPGVENNILPMYIPSPGVKETPMPVNREVKNPSSGEKSKIVKKESGETGLFPETKKNKKNSKEEPQENKSFRYKGDIAGARDRIASEIGYGTQTVGQYMPIQVEFKADGQNWKEVVEVINTAQNDASLFIDNGKQVVILRYWR